MSAECGTMDILLPMRLRRKGMWDLYISHSHRLDPFVETFESFEYLPQNILTTF